MSLITGIIYAIDQGTVSKGHFAGSLFKTITLTTGNKLTAFDVDFVEGLEIGKEYTFPVEQSGNYTNIIGTVTGVIQTDAPVTEISHNVLEKEVEEESRVTMSPIPSAKQNPYQANKDTAIRRAVALKASVKYTAGQEATPEQVIAIAKVFEAYLA